MSDLQFSDEAIDNVYRFLRASYAQVAAIINKSDGGDDEC